MVPVTVAAGRAPHRGFTLAELLVGVVLGGVVTAAVCRLLQDNQRFYRSQSQVLEVQQGLRAVAHVLSGELRELDARDGDLVALGRDSVTIRAMRGFGIVCGPPDAAGESLVIADALTVETREPDPSRDRALVFADGDAASAADDVWLDFGVAAVSSGKSCSDGSPATLVGLSGAAAALAGVSEGSPLRTYERTTYRLYADAEGLAWLGERHLSSGAWSPLSPVAGPLRRGDGIAFTYRDSSGAETAAPDAVAGVDIVLRGLSTEPIAIPGRRATGQRYRDSMAVRVTLRNNPADGP